MPARVGQGFCYGPGLLYDIAFSRIFRGLRIRVKRAVEAGALYPWLDVCCGTGDQFRRPAAGPERPRLRPGGKALSGHPPGSQRGRAVYGLDLSCRLLRYAAARNPGVPFVCGDAARLPFRDRAFRAVSVSFGLHDKAPDVRQAMMADARRVLAPDGRLIAVDFVRPWSAGSRLGALFAQAIESLAGAEHYGNGRDFLRRGGLEAFLRENGFAEVSRHDIATGSIAFVAAIPATDRV